MRTIRQQSAPSPVAIALVAVALSLCALAPASAHAQEGQRNLPLLVIVVEFDGGADGDPVPYDSDIDWSTAVFGADDSLASFYSAMSDGAFAVVPARESSAAGREGNHNGPDREDDGIVHVTLPEPHGAWGLVNGDPAVTQDFAGVVVRALNAAGRYVDLGSYDVNHDGRIGTEELAVCLCIAGYDASALGDPGEADVPAIWPHAGMLANILDPQPSVDGLAVDSYIAFAEYLWHGEGSPEGARAEYLGVLYHELGHYLGLPDLYPLNDQAESQTWGAYRVGALSLMDTGGWTEVPLPDGTLENKPAALDAWSRYVLGWNMPLVVTGTGDYEVRSQLSAEGYQSLLIPTDDPDEFFLLENRQPEGFDEAIAGEYSDGNPLGGIVVWHVDKGTYRRYGLENTVNDTVHRPAVMEVFFETTPDGSEYSGDWATSVPDTAQPFYDSSACARNLGDPGASVGLPTYNDGPNAESPSARLDSRIALRFPSESAREMTVHVDMSGTEAANSSREHPLADARLLRAPNDDPNPSVAEIACAALIRETGADIAVIDSGSITAGIPQGALGWGDVYAVLPADSSMVVLMATGAQLRDILEQAAETLQDANSDEAMLFGGVSCIIDGGAPAGERVSDIRIGQEEIDPQESYRIVTLKSTLALCPALDSLGRDATMLWGSPADALRSFMLTPSWEATAGYAGEIIYLEPETPPVEPGRAETHGEGATAEPPAIAIIGTVIAILLAACALARLRQQG